MPAFDTLRYVEGRLELIDQRLLPREQHYFACRCAADVAEAIRQLVVRGAPAIGCAAAYGVALEAQRLQTAGAAAFRSGMEAAFTRLAASRPTAVNLFWALDRMRQIWQSAPQDDPAAVAAALLSSAHAMREEDIRINRQLGRHGAALLADGMQVLTHCNAGALATAGHGTALGVIRSAVDEGKKLTVLVDETRPFLQGARLTAWELVEDGIPVVLIADSAAGHLMAQGAVDAVIVGADRVAANGDVANKIGTYPVAVLARRHGIPFYVACPLSTIDRGVPTGADIPVEERSGDEILGYGGLRWAPAEVRTRNPVFDITPADLVSALVTERGILTAPDRSRIEGLFR